MKVKKNQIVIFFFMLVFSTCSTKTVRQPLDVETEIINISSFKRIETISIPESIIKNENYVKLDGSSDDIQFKNIDILKIANNRIFVLDVMLRKLVSFDFNGKGLGAVGSRGQGPEEYLRIHDFCLNNVGNIFLMDGTTGKRKLLVFDNDFKFVSVQPLPFSANYVHRLDNEKFLFALNSWNKENDASTQIVITNDKLETEKAYLQFDEFVDENFVIGISTFTCFGDKILYHRTIDNFVYEFSKGGEPLKIYFFDFGSRDVPNNVRKNIEENLDEFERYSCIRNIVLINDKYIAGVLYDERKNKPFIIDRIENCLYVINRQEKGIRDMLWCFENNLISCLYPGMYDNIQFSHLPQDVKEHLEHDDFVLCLYELK